MRKPLLGSVLGVLLAVSAAVAAPKPVITVDGVVKATRIEASVRDMVATKILALNAQLEKVRDRNPTAEQLADIHEQCMALHDAIVQQMDPGQRHAFAHYLHEQMKAAGIDVDAFAGHHANHH